MHCLHTTSCSEGKAQMGQPRSMGYSETAHSEQNGVGLAPSQPAQRRGNKMLIGLSEFLGTIKHYRLHGPISCVFQRYILMLLKFFVAYVRYLDYQLSDGCHDFAVGPKRKRRTTREKRREKEDQHRYRVILGDRVRRD